MEDENSVSNPAPSGRIISKQSYEKIADWVKIGDIGISESSRELELDPCPSGKRRFTVATHLGVNFPPFSFLVTNSGREPEVRQK